MIERHQVQRQSLKAKQQERWTQETNERADRLPRGLKGLWTRITGKYGKIRQQNECEAEAAKQRDRFEHQALIDRQLEDRRILQRQIIQVRNVTALLLKDLVRDSAYYKNMGNETVINMTSKSEQTWIANPHSRSLSI